MKLKVVVSGTIIKFALEIENDQVSFHYLRSVIRTQLRDYNSTFAERSFDISLNGRTPIQIDDNLSVAAAGIVPGDILRLIVRENKSLSYESLFQSSKMEGVKCFLSTKEETTVNNIDQTRTDVTHIGPNLTNKETNELHNMDETQMEATSINPSQNNDRFINRCMNTALLCRESTDKQLPCSLIREFAKSEINTKGDAALVVLKVLMMEEGFIYVGDETQHRIDENTKKLQFTYSNCSNAVCYLMCICHGDFIWVNAMFSSEVFLSGFLMSLYVRPNPQDHKDPLEIYQRLPTLSRKFKDRIVLPLKQKLRTEVGIDNFLCLETLPTELLIYILRKIDVPNLIKVSRLSKQFYKLGNDNMLWRILYLRSFKPPTSDRWKKLDQLNIRGFWKNSYKEAYLEKIRPRDFFGPRAPWSFLDDVWPPDLSVDSGYNGPLPTQPTVDFSLVLPPPQYIIKHTHSESRYYRDIFDLE